MHGLFGGEAQRSLWPAGKPMQAIEILSNQAELQFKADLSDLHLKEYLIEQGNHDALTALQNLSIALEDSRWF